MRRLYTSLVAVAATLVPVLALAENPNQQMADKSLLTCGRAASLVTIALP